MVGCAEKSICLRNIMKAEKGIEKYAEHTEIMTFLLPFIMSNVTFDTLFSCVCLSLRVTCTNTEFMCENS